MFDRRLVRKGFGDLPCLNTRRFMLRGVRQVAAALGCDETAAVLQYNDVILYMLTQFTPGPPLAALTHQQAWACLLDDAFWHQACPRRLVGASHVLRKLVRFYISIEDGECTVERDFAFLRNEQAEHRTANVEFLDDCLIAKLLGPRTVAEFDVVAWVRRPEKSSRPFLESVPASGGSSTAHALATATLPPHARPI